MTQDVALDEVRLAVPATPGFLRLARVTASGLASRVGFSYDEVEDLRLAMDELAFALIGRDGREGTVQLRYVLCPDALEVVGVGTFEGERHSLELSPLTERVLASLVDEYTVEHDEHGRTQFRLRNAVDPLDPLIGRSPTIPELARAASVSEEEMLEALEDGQVYRLTTSDGSALAVDSSPVPTDLGETLVHLRFFEGLTQSAIASQLGVSKMRLAPLLANTLAKLRSASDPIMEAGPHPE